MKNILKYLFITTILFTSILGYKNVFADKNQDCLNSIKENKAVSFTKMTGFIEKNITVLKINTKQCHGITLNISLIARRDDFPIDDFINMSLYSLDKKKDINSIQIVPTDSDDTIFIALRTNESYCYGSFNNPDCQIYTEIKVGADCNNEDCTFSSKDSLISISETFDYNQSHTIPDKAFENGVLFGQCEGSCGSDPWYSMVRGGSRIDDQTIKKCRDSLHQKGAITLDPVDKITRRKTTLKIKTTGCKDIPLKLSLNATEEGFRWADMLLLVPFYNVYYATYRIYDSFNREVTIDDKLNNKSGINKIFFTPKDDTVTLTFLANDDSCYGSYIPDCIIIPRITTTTTPNTDVSTPDIKTLNKELDNYKDENSNDSTKKTIREKVAENGIILSDCDTINCSLTNNNWELEGMTGAYDNGNTPQSVSSTIDFDENSPCYSETKGINPITGEEGEGYLPNCYEFLAPIQGIELDSERKQDNGTFQIKNDPNTGRTRIAIKDIRNYELGNYINKLFQIAIAILGVISVIMIIIAGVQYMTVESVYGKSDAKQRIINAVTGLLLALGIFTILHTINPKLLEVNFGKNIKSAHVETDDSPPTVNADGTIGNSNLKQGSPWPPTNSGYKTLRKGGINSLETIINGVYVNKKECTTVGKHTTGGDDCTSVYFTPDAFNKVKNGLEKLKSKSGATKIVITGGSEFWWHGTHKAEEPIVDIRSSSAESNSGPKLSTFLSGNSSYPGQCYERHQIPDAESYIEFALDESGAGNGNLCDKDNKIYPTPEVVKTHRKNGIIKKGATKTKVRSCCWNPNEHWHIVFK